MVRQIVKFVANDGSEHETELDAKQWEIREALRKSLDLSHPMYRMMHGIAYSPPKLDKSMVTVDSVIDWVLKNPKVILDLVYLASR